MLTINDPLSFLRDIIFNKNMQMPVMNVNQIDIFRERPTIYFLLNDKDKILYVGQTNNLLQRITEHLNGKYIDFKYKKYFDKFCWFHLDNSKYINDMESILINIYHPKYNKKIPTVPRIESSLHINIDLNKNTFKKMYGKNLKGIYLKWLKTAKNFEDSYVDTALTAKQSKIKI